MSPRLRPLPSPRALAVAVGALLVVLSFLLVAQAKADIYWTNELTKIGRAAIDGTSADNELVSGTGEAFGIGADASHIYWGDNTQGTIVRAELDGKNATDFVKTGGEAYGITVAGGYLYWTEPGNGKIGRAKTDGSAVEPSFITSAPGATGVAADANHLYWASTSSQSIVRANLDGSGIESSFITGLFAPYGLTVDADHIYWSDDFFLEPSIGRSNLDGTGVEKAFITGIQVPHAVLVDENHIYWSDFGGSHAIARADLDGKNVEPEFIGSGELAFGMAINPPVPPTPTPEPSPTPDPTPSPSPNPSPSPPASGGGSPAPQPTAAAPACTKIEASAATFTPTPRPGAVVPGVRAQVSVSGPAAVSIAPTLIYRQAGKVRKASLPATSLRIEATRKIRFALPANLASVLPLGTAVRLSLDLTVRPEGKSSCTAPASVKRSVKAKVVKVLAKRVGTPT